jgi:tartrate-resistant acid phosphatase type 5
MTSTKSDLSRRTVIGAIAATAALAPLARATAAARPLSFLAFGDWGRDGAQHQRDVAVQMGKAAAELRSSFVASVGDNFYENGVQSATDPQWLSSFETIYTDPALQIPWYAVLGNHDYRGVPQAQIDYAAHSQRWKMPSRYYKVPGAEIGAPFADLFVIDSSPLVHQYRDKVEEAIAANVKSQDAATQLAWLDKELGQSTARWKLVLGHHTIRSGGSGHGETRELVELVRPLLERHGVQAYINGHDHDLQHISDGGVDYICCGAGSEVRPVKAVKGTKFCLSRSGFATLTLDETALALGFRDYTGAVVYSATIPHDRAKAAA